MEVTFNGKKIAITSISTEIFGSLLDNATKNINKYGDSLSRVFSEAYRIVLVARLGVRVSESQGNAGVGTGLLKQSIKVKKKSVSFIRDSKISGTIRMKHIEDFGSRQQAGLTIGHDGAWRKLSGTKGSAIALDKMERWIRTKKGNSFDFSGFPKDKNKPRALARLILFRWSQGERKHVLPKWYDVFKDNGEEARKALYKNRSGIEKSIKNILNG